MPLTMVSAGAPCRIQRITGREKTRRFLQNLGFVEGARVTVVCESGKNLILAVRDARVALDRTLAMRLLVEQEVAS